MLSVSLLSSTLARRFGSATVLLLAAALGIGSHERGQKGQAPREPFVCHEWGTFTSIAGTDGQALEWLPFSAKSDLPSFVEVRPRTVGKGALRGTIRMETPVIYFYSAREVSVSVQVSFSQGLITEWYPHGVAAPGESAPYLAITPEVRSSVSWPAVTLTPEPTGQFATESRSSHYYAARETASTALAVATPTGEQLEKFLFYRGVAGFSPPLSAQVRPKGQLRLENRLEQDIPALVLFERRGERIGYRVLRLLQRSSTAETPSTSGTFDSLRGDFERLLVAQGLYAEEAHAMLETWQDTWFEEGSRLFYIVPRRFVDSVLPLTIRPEPHELVRVFVGRIELVTPATAEAVKAALRTNDDQTLKKYDRFLTAIISLLSQQSPGAERAAQLWSSWSGDVERAATGVARRR
jgi:hypothetical protein